jgi:hypothetical protein
MKFSLKVHVRPLDIVIFGLAAVLVLGTSLLVLNRQSGTRYVQITGESGEWIAPLDKDAEYEIPGPLGLTHVHIHDGKAAIIDSPCKNKLCILAGAISEPNQWVACLPNKVFMRITSSGGKDDGGVDAGAF